MTIAWPVTIPYFVNRDGFSGVPFRAPLKTDMDDGQPRLRPSSTKNVATIRMSMPMTNANFATFKSWARDTLLNGTLPFQMMVFTGSDYELKTCTLVGGTYADSANGIEHVISFSLDVEDY